MKHWFAFLVTEFGESEGHWVGPTYLTDEEMFDLVANTRAQHLGMNIYKFIYSYGANGWMWDPRSDTQVLEKAPIPGYIE